MRTLSLCTTMILATLPCVTAAQFIPSEESLSRLYPDKAYSPYAQRSFPSHVFWGAPTFMVYALRDSIGANLDRIQIIKGWLDAEGATQERVYDVAWSQGREMDANGKVPAVGNTVDIENANWTNTIGASELGTVWTDPDFDPAQPAFYYARVLEIPTPRWVVYDAFRFDVPIPEGAEAIGQERAYTSPIWYTPS